MQRAGLDFILTKHVFGNKGKHVWGADTDASANADADAGNDAQSSPSSRVLCQRNESNRIL